MSECIYYDFPQYRQPISDRYLAELHIRHRADIENRYRTDIDANIGPISDRYEMFIGIILQMTFKGTSPL